jgi:hypothetical protein
MAERRRSVPINGREKETSWDTRVTLTTYPREKDHITSLNAVNRVTMLCSWGAFLCEWGVVCYAHLYLRMGSYLFSHHPVNKQGDSLMQMGIDSVLRTGRYLFPMKLCSLITQLPNERCAAQGDLFYLFTIHPVKLNMLCSWVGLYSVLRMGLLFDTRPAVPKATLYCERNGSIPVLDSTSFLVDSLMQMGSYSMLMGILFHLFSNHPFHKLNYYNLPPDDDEKDP